LQSILIAYSGKVNAVFRS